MHISVVFKRIFKIKRLGERKTFFSISKSNNQKEVKIKLILPFSQIELINLLKEKQINFKQIKRQQQQ